MNIKKKNTFLLLGAILLFACFQAIGQESKIEKGMVKVTIMYPNEEGKTFDMEYYSTKHMPMVADLFGDFLRAMSIEKGMVGRTPEEPAPYVAMGSFYFDKIEDYGQAFGPNADKILGDIPNYTDIQPVVLIGEVVK